MTLRKCVSADRGRRIVRRNGDRRSAASAQTVKIGLINTYSGPMASNGDQIEKAINLFMKLGQCKLPAGVKLEIIKRDDTGINPETAKRLAQELIVRDKVQMITGVVWTPNALSIAPLVTEAKVPFVIMNAGTAMITERSPYIARTSFTLWQSSYPMGTWAAKRFKTAYVAVADFGPGHDAQEAFTKAFTAAGGKVIGTVRMPPPTSDFAPFLQRVKDAKPDALFVFVPAGKSATAFMKGFGDLGLGAGGDQADRARRHRDRRGAAEHGRRPERRHDDVPLLCGR